MHELLTAKEMPQWGNVNVLMAWIQENRQWRPIGFARLAGVRDEKEAKAVNQDSGDDDCREIAEVTPIVNAEIVEPMAPVVAEPFEDIPEEDDHPLNGILIGEGDGIEGPADEVDDAERPSTDDDSQHHPDDSDYEDGEDGEDGGSVINVVRRRPRAKNNEEEPADGISDNDETEEEDASDDLSSEVSDTDCECKGCKRMRKMMNMMRKSTLTDCVEQSCH